MHVIPSSNYTLDASAGTITLTSPYNTLELTQIISILDLDTNDMIFDVEMKRDYISISAGVITYTCDTNITVDTDDLRIIINDTAGGSINSDGEILVAGYNSTLNSLKTIEQAPVDQQVIDAVALDAVTATGASTDIYTLDKGVLSVVVVASAVSTGGTIKVQGTPDGTNYVDLATFTAGNLTGATSQSISSNGTYVFTVDTRVAMKYARVNLSARTDGTYTAYVFGRPI